MSSDSVRLGDLLVKSGIITPEQLQRAIHEQRKVPGVKLGKVLIELGFCTKKDVLTAITRQVGFEVGHSKPLPS